MAKTIIVKGANFSTNKLTTVEFNDTPCTGISFGAESYTADSLGELAVTYTVTPADTTDDVVFASSDENVVAVTADGFEAVGVGSCTITITCGDYSDTATVSVSVVYDFNWIFSLLSEASGGYVTGTASAYARLGTLGTEDQATTYKILGVGFLEPAVKLPANTGRVKIKATNTAMLANSSDSQMLWAKDESAGYSGQPQAIKCVSAEDKYNIRNESEKTYTVPSGVDSMAFTTKLYTAAESTDNPNTIATSCGLSIEFLPPAE